MAASKNSRNSRRSKSLRGVTIASPFVSVSLCALACFATMACAVWYFYKNRRYALLWRRRSSSEHCKGGSSIRARREWYQVGTTWLPLPHLLMIPFVRHDHLWMTGLAGAIPSGIAMALAGVFFFAAVRRAFGSAIAALAATTVFLPESQHALSRFDPDDRIVLLRGAVCVVVFHGAILMKHRDGVLWQARRLRSARQP